MGMVRKEKHELTLSFNSSKELFEFAKNHQNNIVLITDYEYYEWEVEDGNVD